MNQCVKKADTKAQDTDLWVFLILHTLNQHALDHFHVMLLLIAKDTWEVPVRGGNKWFRKRNATVLLQHSLTPISCFNRLWLICVKIHAPENMQRCFSEADVLRVDRIEQELQDLWPLIVAVIIFGQKQRVLDRLYTKGWHASGFSKVPSHKKNCGKIPSRSQKNESHPVFLAEICQLQ